MLHPLPILWREGRGDDVHLIGTPLGNHAKATLQKNIELKPGRFMIRASAPFNPNGDSI